MREQLRQEVLRRFAGAPDTQQARDLRDEILSNTLQRYDDLLAGGKSEQEAYASALESVGDVEELLSSLPRAAQAEPVREAQPKAEAPEKEPQSRGMRIACAIVWPCSALLAVVIGAILYYIVIQVVLWLGLNTNDLKMLQALVVAMFLAVPYWKNRYFKKKGDANHG